MVDDGHGIQEQELFVKVGEWHHSSKAVDVVSLQPEARARTLSYNYGLKGEEALAAIRSLFSSLRVTTRQQGSVHTHSKVFDDEMAEVACHSRRCGYGEAPKDSNGSIPVAGTIMDQELKFGTSVGASVWSRRIVATRNFF